MIRASVVKLLDECKCWDGYEAVKSLSGSYYCRGTNINKLFQCNAVKPPRCQCTIKGKQVELPLGETSCYFEKCDNQEEWLKFFTEITNFRELGK